jgi:hypothetical protein
MDERSTCWAACSSKRTPTAVDPVNETLRALPLASHGPTTSPAWLVQTTLRTPAGRPASVRMSTSSERGQRGELGRLEHHRAAGRDGRADLAGAHGQREVPGRHEDARAHRLAADEDAGLAVAGQAHVAADPHRLLGEPAEELGAVRDLATRLGERLAHLHGHQRGEIVLAFDDEFVGSAQDFAPFPGRGAGPVVLPGGGHVDGPLGVPLAAVGDRGQHLLGRRVDDLQGPAGRRGLPGPVDEQAGGDAVDDLLGAGGLPRRWRCAARSWGLSFRREAVQVPQ